MTLLTFPWADVGQPDSMDITDICHTIEHPYGAGYAATRPESAKMQKAFAFGWKVMTSAQWLAFVEFWRSVYGNANAFYWQFPSAMYGSPGYGGYGGIEPPDGFDSDVEVGYGEGPVFTVRFIEKEQPQKWRTDSDDLWIVDTAVREVA